MPRINPTAAKLRRFLSDATQKRIAVGVMPVSLSHALRSKVRIIRLYSGTAKKITTGKHQLLPEHFLIIPIMMDMAWVGADAKRHFTFLYYEEHVFHKTFKLIVKCNRQGRELIVSTFHRVEADQVRRIKKRCARVRDGKV